MPTKLAKIRSISATEEKKPAFPISTNLPFLFMLIILQISKTGKKMKIAITDTHFTRFRLTERVTAM